jgi:hypothetical protein
MRLTEPVAALGGLLTLIALALPWYGATGPNWSLDAERAPTAAGELPTFSAFTAMTVIDFLIAFVALLAILVPIATASTSGPAKSIAAAVVASAFGWIAILLVLFRIVDMPGDQLEVRYGAWLALAGTIIAWVGSWLSLRDESTPGAVTPDVPVRPAPTL